MLHSAKSIAIRRATEADRLALERLAALDSARVPVGEVLIAEVGDEAQAAIEVASGTAIADPFRPSGHLVELLSLRAARLRTPLPVRGRVGLRRRPPTASPREPGMAWLGRGPGRHGHAHRRPPLRDG